MKSLPNIAAACLGLAAGALLVIASREGQTQASHEPPPAIIAPKQATVIAPVITPLDSEQPAPQPVVWREGSNSEPTPPAVLTSYGDCPNGVCAPRAAVVAKRATTQRSGLFSGRLFRRR